MSVQDTRSLTAPMCVPLAHLGQLIPMHVLLAADGTIRSIGPTLRKVLAAPIPPGASFFSVFEIRRPGGVADCAGLRARAGQRLNVAPRGEERSFRSFAVPLADGGMILNLSFGIDVFDAVASYGLTDLDFTPTDMTVEMLYLQEAKSAVMGELRGLNRRLADAKSAAENQAMTDMLTGLSNRRALDQRLATVTAAGLDFSLIHMDLDYFKAVNDSLGHAAGDHVLREVARVLRETTRRSDTASRIGGDEFVIVMPGLTERAALAALAERLIARLSEPIDYDGQPCRISASVGITRSVDYAEVDVTRMLADADAALYASKNAGRGRAAFHSA